MATSELKQYPRGQIAFGPGDLTQVTNVTFTTTNNAKLVHTLNKAPAGVVLGNRETNGKFDVVVDEDGLEREYFDRVRSGERITIRLKIPGNITKPAEIVLVSIDCEMPLDDAVKMTINWIGQLQKS